METSVILEAIGDDVHPASQNRSPSVLRQLPHDVLINIAAYLDVRSLVLLASTCKYLQLLLHEKTVWLDALESTILRRPVPLSYRNLVSRSKAAEISLEDIRVAVIRASRLEHNWSKPVVRTARYKKISVELDTDDVTIWVWNLDVDRYTMMITKQGWLICQINATNHRIAFQLEKDLHCWDFDLDLEGITVVVNNGDGFTDYMDVFRINLGDHTYRRVKRIQVSGWARSNILEDEIAGCVISPGRSSPTKLYMVNWKTGKAAVIDTGLLPTHNLSASTTKQHLLIWYEEGTKAHAWTYTFEFLKGCVDKANLPEELYTTTAPPQFYHITNYIDQEIPRAPWINPTTKGMWNSNKSVMSVLYDSLNTDVAIVYSVVDDGTSQIHSSTMEFDTAQAAQSRSSSGHIDTGTDTSTRQSSSLSKRNFIYTFSEGVSIAEDIGHRQLYVFGESGKHALWVEDCVVDGVIKNTVRLATFDHRDNSLEGPVQRTASEVLWNHDEFDWTRVSDIHLDDSTGVLTCSTGKDIWYLYFD